MSRNIYSALLIFAAILFSFPAMTQDHNHDGHDHSGHDHSGHSHDDHAGHDHGSHDGHDHGSHDSHGEGGSKYDPAGTAIHHISDGNIWSIMEFPIPLPMILKSDAGWDIFMSSKFGVHAGSHEDGNAAYNGYVMHHGSAYRVKDAGFPMKGSVNLGEHAFSHSTKMVDGKEKTVNHVSYQG